MSVNRRLLVAAVAAAFVIPVGADARRGRGRGGDHDEAREALERTECGQRLSFENNLGSAILPLGEVALMELAGPLLENAARYARSIVRISGDNEHLCVEDDGAGLDDAGRVEALGRGRRLDEAAHGHGLGLAIARDVAELSGGVLTLGRSTLGGLSAEARWVVGRGASALAER